MLPPLTISLFPLLNPVSRMSWANTEFWLALWEAEEQLPVCISFMPVEAKQIMNFSSDFTTRFCLRMRFYSGTDRPLSLHSLLSGAQFEFRFVF